MRVKAEHDVRLAFDQWLWKPQPPMNEGQAAKYGTVLILDPGSPFHEAVKKAMSDVCAQKYQAPDVWKTLQRDKRCLRTGEEQVDRNGAVRESFKGKQLLVVKNPKPFLILDADLRPLPADSARPYAGCYVRPIVDIYAFEVKGVRGVYATIEGLQFSRDGERISGGGSTATVEDFTPLAGQSLDSKPATAGNAFD